MSEVLPTTTLIASTESSFFVFKIGQYLPFIFLNITYVELIIHIRSDSLYKSIFYKITIILGIVEVTGHFFQFLIFYEVRISPLVVYFSIYSPPSWQFTVIINGLGFGLISQASYSFYLSLIKFVAVYFPLSTKMIQNKSYYFSHILILFLCGTIILCSPIYYGNYIIDLDELMYTKNQPTGTFPSYSLFFDRSNRHIYTTILTGILTVLSVMTNFFTYLKFKKKKSNSFVDSISQAMKKKSEKNMNLLVFCLTTKQFLFLLFNILQAWKPKLQQNDNSIYHITQGLKPWVMHINFFFSAYAMLYFNKIIRLKLINIILCSKSSKRINTKSGLITTQGTIIKKQKNVIL
uniref:7TM GPCR serpentine receptor class x (Srx) domain-containing protein n=1 Tax=Strongyloides stercoralis TaxID=6248 RepID=A0AAF5D1P2_STRER